MLHKHYPKYLMMLSIQLMSLYIQAQVQYPYPVQHFNITLENKPVQIAYMDARPDSLQHKPLISYTKKK